jgi:hypothetical protein
LEVARYLGEEWSKARWSQAEKADSPSSVRGFTADELYAFSLTFNLPVIWFLMPAGPDEGEVIPGSVGTVDPGMEVGDYLEAIWPTHFDFMQWGEFERRIVGWSRVLGIDITEKIATLLQPQAGQAVRRTVGEVFEVTEAMNALQVSIQKMLVEPLWRDAIQALSEEPAKIAKEEE